MRVGILTSGGDCQALNATMRGLALTLYRNVKDVEIIGFIDGYKGLMYEKYRKMKPADFYDILKQVIFCAVHDAILPTNFVFCIMTNYVNML